jgi:hypothetical protein
MVKMKNSEIGSVYAIKTSIGYGLFQCVQHNDIGIDVVRVLQPIIQNINEFSPELLQESERYFIKFTVQAALNSKLIILIGKYNVPSSVKVPKKYRMLDFVPHRNIRNWYIVDAKTNGLRLISNINEKFLSLSCDGIWNDTFLIERLEEGWTLENWK